MPFFSCVKNHALGSFASLSSPFTEIASNGNTVAVETLRSKQRSRKMLCLIAPKPKVKRQGEPSSKCISPRRSVSSQKAVPALFNALLCAFFSFNNFFLRYHCCGCLLTGTNEGTERCCCASKPQNRWSRGRESQLQHVDCHLQEVSQVKRQYQLRSMISSVHFLKEYFFRLASLLWLFACRNKRRNRKMLCLKAPKPMVKRQGKPNSNVYHLDEVSQV